MIVPIRRSIAAMAAFVISLASFGFAFADSAPSALAASSPVAYGLPSVAFNTDEPAPACPAPPAGSIVLPISDPAELRLTTRSWPEGHKQMPGVPAIPAGEYVVSLGSFDPSHFPVPPGDTRNQPREEWLLEFWTADQRIAESPATPDLPDDQWFDYYPALGVVTLDEDVTRVFVRHDLWSPGSATDPSVAGVLEPASTVNSIDPACVYLTPVPPEPGRIVVVKGFDINADGVEDDLPPGAASPDFLFTPSWGEGFTLAIGASAESGDLAAGTYSVSEDPEEIRQDGFDWFPVPGGATCSDGSPVEAIEVSEGETVVCTFLNTRTDVQQVTTTTTEPTTTTTTAPTTTSTAPTTSTSISPSTLPFTGSGDGSLVGIGVAFAVMGLLLLAGAHRRGSETA